MTATASLAELRGTDEPRFGGKSAALGELIGGGIPVPPGFAVSTEAFALFITDASLDTVIAGALAGAAPDDVQAVRSASATIAAAVRGAPVPEPIRADIARGYAQLGEAEPAVAVRSSACGEDSVDATFAGQQETYLWVRGADRVCDAVRDCWASLYSPEAIAYRARMADPGDATKMGVAVQLMVDAEVSGVMFTCNPVSGDRSVIAINASWGLGSAVVGGEVTPDEYLVSKVTGEVVRRAINRKEIEHRPDAGGSGTVSLAVPAERAEAPCLDEERLRTLVGVARTVERHFGSHQDIEWALDQSGGVHVLQSRPVTAAPKVEGPKGQSALELIMSKFGA